MREKSEKVVVNMNAEYDELFKKYMTCERKVVQPCMMQVRISSSTQPSSELVTCEKVLSNGENS